MAGDDKTLKDVLKEAHSEAKPETKPEGISQSQETETKSGEPVYASGIDISDIPEQDRTRIKDLIEKKAKLLEKGYQDKFKEVASLKKAQEDIINEGVSIEEAREAILEKARSKRNPPLAVEKKEAKKTLDSLIDGAPLEQKESLRQLRQILMEETEVDSLRKKVSEMEGMLKGVSSGYADVRKKEIEVDISALSSRYGKDLVEKYHDVMVDEALRFNVPPSQVLRFRASDDELEQAILAKTTKKKEKLEAVTSTGSGLTGSSETINTSGKWKDVLRQVIKTQK